MILRDNPLIDGILTDGPEPFELRRSDHTGCYSDAVAQYAAIVAERQRLEAEGDKADGIVSVPLNARKILMRHYDAAELLTKVELVDTREPGPF